MFIALCWVKWRKQSDYCGRRGRSDVWKSHQNKLVQCVYTAWVKLDKKLFFFSAAQCALVFLHIHLHSHYNVHTRRYEWWEGERIIRFRVQVCCFVMRKAQNVCREQRTYMSDFVSFIAIVTTTERSLAGLWEMYREKQRKMPDRISSELIFILPSSLLIDWYLRKFDSY